MDTVRVQGLRRSDGQILDEEDLVTFFEHPDQGYGPVSVIKFDKVKNEAWLKFTDPHSAKKVLAMKNFQLAGHSLTAVQQEGVRDALGNAGGSSDHGATVLIEKLPQKLEKDELEMLIDSPDYGIAMDGKFTSTEIYPTLSVAIVQFSTASDAVKLRRKGFVKYNQQKMVVAKPDTPFPSAVMITGLCHDMEEELLKLYFSSPRTGGGKTIEMKYFEPQHGFAVIIYEEETVARTVIEKKVHVIRNKEIKAKQWIPGEENKLLKKAAQPLDSETSSTHSGSASSQPCATAPRSQEGMTSSSENKASEEDDEDMCSVRIRMQDSSYEPCMVFVSGDLTEVKKELLTLYLENAAQAQIQEIMYGVRPGIARIEFKTEIDYQALKNKVWSDPMDGVTLEVSRVERSTVIQVYSSVPREDKLLNLYFINKQRSGGSDKAIVKRVGELVHLVDFGNATDAKRVVGRQHCFEDGDLIVALHYDALGLIPPGYDTSKPFIEIPDDKVINRDPLLVKYIKEGNNIARHVNESLKKHYGQIDLSHPAENEIKIKCLLKHDMDDIQSIAKQWHDTVLRALENVLESYGTRTVSCSPKSWQEVYDQVCKYKEAKKHTKLMIKENKHNYTVDIIGPTENLHEALAAIEQIWQDIQEKQNVGSKDIDIPFRKLKVLQKLGITNEIKKQWPQVKVVEDHQAQKITLNGNNNDILNAALHVHTKLQDIEEHEVPMSKLQIKVLNSTNGLQYMERLLRANKLITEIEPCVDKVIITGPKAEIHGTSTLLTNEIVESIEPISEGSRLFVRGKGWDQFVERCRKKSSMLQLEMAHDLTSLKIAGIFDKHQEFKKAFAEYLKVNTIKIEFIPAPRGCIKLLSRYSQKELKQIELDCVDFHVTIQIQLDETKNQECGVIVKGALDGLGDAMKLVHSQIRSVVTQSKIVSQPGLPKFLMSDSNTMILCGVENTCEVVIEVSDVDIGSYSVPNAAISPQMSVLDSVVTRTGNVVKVILGDLTEHKVDAVVNPANKFLKHKGGLSRALAEKGGDSIQKDCDAYIKNKTSLRIGEAMKTTAGKLPCKWIIHTLGPHWNDGEHEEENILYDCVQQCLRLAQDEGIKSIAFPAIGAGIFGWPVERSTKTIVEAVSEFLSSDWKIKEIHLVGDKEDIANCFAIALANKFGTTEATKQLQAAAGQNNGTGKGLTGGKTKEGININLIKAENAKWDTDAVVNIVPPSLNFSTEFSSNSIMARMDSVNRRLLQGQVNAKKSDKVVSGDVIVTGAGHSTVLEIFHAVVSQSETDPAPLQKALDHILITSHGNGYKSLAIPVMSKSKLPAKVLADTLVCAVTKFSSKEPKTNLKTISFIFDTSDANSMTEFQSRLSRLQGTGKAQTNQGLAKAEAKTPSGPFIGELMISKVKLQVTTGDITQETTDVIVNSTNAELDLSWGSVSKALLEAGGEDFRMECRELGTLRPLEVKAGGPGQLKCKTVLHFDALSVQGNWKHVIQTCLQEAESAKMGSIAFPALGTGLLGNKPEEMAMCMIDAIAEFAKKATYVKHVKVLVFQKEMLQPYFDQMQKVSTTKPSFWGKFKQWIGFGDSEAEGSKPTPASGDSATEAATQQYGGSNLPSAKLDIFAFKEENIAEAMDHIDKLWMGQKADQILGGAVDPNTREIIRKLQESEQKVIKEMAKGTGVRVTVESNRKTPQIRIEGQLKDATSVESRIKEYLHQLEMKTHKREEAQLLFKFVQWEYEERPGVFTPYPEETNIELEKAFAQKKGSVAVVKKIDDQKEEKITVDLQNKSERDGTGKKKAMRRRDLSQVAYSLPDSWSQMSEGERFTKVELKKNDQEYLSVAKAFNLTCPRNFSIKIERLQNPILYRRYIVHKKDLEKECPDIQAERMLWHGTNRDVIDNICFNGFNRSYHGANGTRYGKGVYFAAEASYSVGFATPDAQAQRYLFYASVLTGEYCVGDPRMVEPPPKDPAKPHILYDSTVNMAMNPDIFVVYRDTQVYPHYLITLM